MFSEEVIKEYLLKNICWPNKQTVPVVKINKIIDNGESLTINHDVLFKQIECDQLKKYLSSIECTCWKVDIRNFIRERNLNSFFS